MNVWKSMKIGQEMFLPKECEAERTNKNSHKRFYNILSCLPPNIAPILAFVIELLSIVQAPLGWQKRVWNCKHFFHVYNKKKTFYWTDVKQLKKEDVLKSFTFDKKIMKKMKEKWTKEKVVEKYRAIKKSIFRRRYARTSITVRVFEKLKSSSILSHRQVMELLPVDRAPIFYFEKCSLLG